jgi:thiamine transporter ThiT
MKETKTRTPVQKLTLSALFMAMGLVLPFLTGQIPQIGSMLLPMHIPVLFCGLICGWQYGGLVGFVVPLLRSVLFGMPPMYPTAFAMAFELATYGILTGVLYSRFRKQNVATLYISLIGAMVGGRIVWGVVRVIQSGVAGSAFTWELFLAGAVLNAIPGIVLQLVLIPVVMVALDRAGLVRFRKEAN